MKDFLLGSNHYKLFYSRICLDILYFKLYHGIYLDSAICVITFSGFFWTAKLYIMYSVEVLLSINIPSNSCLKEMSRCVYFEFVIDG